MHPARLLPLLLAVAVIGATADVTCSAPGNYTDSSRFGKNVDELLSALSSPPPATVDNYWWFRNHTFGAAPDQVFGLAVCYADADPDLCHYCINSANSTWFSGQLSDRCDHSRNVSFLSSVGCAIRYADAPFFGSADSGYRLILSSVVHDYSASTREARRVLLSQLADRAGGDALRFANGSQRYKQDFDHHGFWHVMYGMAQCTRDLPPSECSSCLIDLLAVMYRDVRVTNSASAAVMGVSCYLKYQMDEPINFIPGMAAVPLAAPPAEPPTGSAAASPAARPVGPKTTVIVALAVAAVTLFSVGA